ncbi:MAG: hypothetical protein E7493_12675 [Ruminococcus albus]|nr:hypothetical protein [Ruminococcus albus]
MTIYNVIRTFFFVVAILLIAFGLPRIIDKYYDGEITKVSVILYTALIAVCVCGIPLTSTAAKKKFYSEIKAKLKNGYVLYINGNETDPKYIEIENYDTSSFTIREKTILISR